MLELAAAGVLIAAITAAVKYAVRLSWRTVNLDYDAGYNDGLDDAGDYWAQCEDDFEAAQHQRIYIERLNHEIDDYQKFDQDREAFLRHLGQGA